MDPIDRSDHLTDHAHAQQVRARAETSKTEAQVLYDALPAWHDGPTVKLICRSDTDCQYWTCIIVCLKNYTAFMRAA